MLFSFLLFGSMAMIHLTFDMVNPPEIVGELTWRHIGFVRYAISTLYQVILPNFLLILS